MNGFKLFCESSLNDLYKSTRIAFPNTKYRENSIDEIVITNIGFTPFVGLKTLFLRGLAENKSNRKQYNSIMLFKNVNYNPDELAHSTVNIVASDGEIYKLKKLSVENSDLLVRCNCLDHSWRWQHYNKLDHSLYGKDRKKYDGLGLWKANTLELPGMCKHLIKFASALKYSGIFLP